jgi:hypothetical protein
MTTKALSCIVAAVVGVVFACALGGALVVGGVAAACSVAGSEGSPGVISPSAGSVSPQQCVDICPEDSGESESAACASGNAVLARAATWLTAWTGGPVPYLSSADPTTWFGGYRRDCSGYASMALGLPGPGLDTAALAVRATPIQKTDLRAGDLLINPAPGGAGHVVIFDHWVDTTMDAYVGYEQSGDGGTHHRVIPYEYFGGYPMGPYRL